MNFGLLKRIPFLGQAIHDFVAQDPEGVARALKGGIGGLIQIGMQLLGRIGWHLASTTVAATVPALAVGINLCSCKRYARGQPLHN